MTPKLSAKWRERLPLCVALLALAVACSAMYYAITTHHRITQQYSNSPYVQVPEQDNSSADAQFYGPIDNAAFVREDYPEYYKCRKYPDNAHIKATDLVPTANVVLTIVYDKAQRRYVVGPGDNQLIKPTEADSLLYPKSKAPVAQQKFTFSFASGVRYFGTFAHYHNSSGWRWSVGGWMYGPHVVNGKSAMDYSLTLFPKDGADMPVYVIIATNPATCAGDGANLPSGFSWKELGSDLVPEYSREGNIHPQS